VLSEWSAGGSSGKFGELDLLDTNNVSVYINPGAIGNTQIGGDIYSSNWMASGGANGWYLDRNGNLYANNGWFRGNITGASGTFSGALSGNTITGATITSTSTLNGVTGTFSGSLTAAAINAVNSINIAGNAVTTSNAVEGSGTVSTSLWVPAGQTMRIVAICHAGTMYLNSINPTTASLSLLINGSAYGGVTSYSSRHGETDATIPAATVVATASFYSSGGQSISVSATGMEYKVLVAFGMIK
jgi:hypothetical protein